MAKRSVALDSGANKMTKVTLEEDNPPHLPDDGAHTSCNVQDKLISKIDTNPITHLCSNFKVSSATANAAVTCLSTLTPCSRERS